LTTVTAAQYSSDRSFSFDGGNKEHRRLGLMTEAITCPAPSCREYTVKASLYRLDTAQQRFECKINEWQLRPDSSAKPVPASVPEQVREDYEEACKVRHLSPKAAAALARRCMSGMVRDYKGILKDRLADELYELKWKVDPSAWAVIDAIRTLGNIGKNMEHETGLICDVDPDEATLLIGLAEMMLESWYVQRQHNERQLDAIRAIASYREGASDTVALQEPLNVSGSTRHVDQGAAPPTSPVSSLSLALLKRHAGG
jgi:hypothetical protein